MARGRMISKAISLDEQVNALSDDTARLLFTWLITHLDCEGRGHGDAVTVKSIVFPRRTISPQKVEKYLKELEKNKLIARYFVNGNQYLWAKNFEKHQIGLRKDKESPSQIPPFTPELGRSKDGVGLLQVKVKVEEETKTKGSSRCFSKEEVMKSYQDNIGKVSAHVFKEIEQAIEKFTAAWVMDAIREAVLHNKLTWVYIRGILNNWKETEKDSGKVRK